MSMNWLLPLVVLPLVGGIVLQAWLQHQTTTRWMRLFSERLGVPPLIMEGEPHRSEPEETKRTPDMRKRISIPIPGASAFRGKVS